MGYSHRTEHPYDRDGTRYPQVVVIVDGVHDVGRFLANLARGSCEQGGLARGIARDLNRTQDGRAVFDLLVRHGGPDLRPPICEPCGEGDCEGCWSVLSPEPEDYCGCYDRDEDAHTTPAAIARATGVA